MRDTEFFKFIFFNVSTILSAIVIILLIVVLFMGLKHRRRLAEQEEVSPDRQMNAGIDSDDQAALREVGLSSAGLGSMYKAGDDENGENRS